MLFQKEIKISSTPETIWQFLVVPKKIVTWYDIIEKCEYLGTKSSGKGTIFYVEKKLSETVIDMKLEAVTWEENKRLSLELISGVSSDNYKLCYDLQRIATGVLFHYTEISDITYEDERVSNMLLKLKNLCENVWSNIVL